MASGVVKDDNKVLYLYGISEKEIPVGQKAIGVDGRSAVKAIKCAGLVCWVSWVSRTDFADNLSSNMENLDWLAEASVHHQRVVSSLSQTSEILPARLGTVFLSQESLEKDVRSKKQFLEDDFRKIRGSDEWGVKVFSVAPKLELPPSSASRSGKEYLKSKAAMLNKRSPGKSVSPAEFNAFSEELRKIAVDAAEAGKVSGGQRGLQWQTSLLLRRADRKRFEALLRKFSKQWAGTRQIECTGPWPPYSFVSRSDGKS